MTRRGGKGSRPPKKTGQSDAWRHDWRAEDPNLEFEKQRYAIRSRAVNCCSSTSRRPRAADRGAPGEAPRMRTDKQRDALAKRLAAMVRDGQAIQGPKGFATAGEGERLAGLVRGRSNGDVLVIPDDGSGALLLARADTASLMHGDRVEVLRRRNERARPPSRTPDPAHRRGPQAHRRHLARGRREWASRAGGSRALVFRRDRRAFRAWAKDGDNVIVEITKRPQGETPAHGRIVEVLAGLRPSDVAARFAIVRHDLPQEFPADVLHEANVFDPRVQPADKVGREDLRGAAAGHHRRRGCPRLRRCGVCRAAQAAAAGGWSWRSPT